MTHRDLSAPHNVNATLHSVKRECIVRQRQPMSDPSSTQLILRASRVRQLRRALRLTQRMLAQKAGVALGSLQGIELATRDVRYPTLEAIALALQTTVADLDAPSTALVIPPPSTLI